MALFAGLDISVKTTAVCILDASGRVVLEATVDSAQLWCSDRSGGGPDIASHPSGPFQAELLGPDASRPRRSQSSSHSARRIDMRAWEWRAPSAVT